MEKRVIKCKVITPMFSYGGNQINPELRPTELKGLMRYIYRITKQIDNSEELFELESKLFGSTEIQSPIRLQMEENKLVRLGKSLTLHRCANNADIKKAIDLDSTFTIILRYKDTTNEQLYENILRLSFYLSGMGKRTRRARGCVRINEELKTPKETKKDICDLLNKVEPDGIYEYNGCIKPKKLSQLMRPVIQMISFGKIIKNDKWRDFLKTVDSVSHKTKGKTKNDALDPTGCSQRASSIIVSVAETTDGYMPIYTYVKAINRNIEIDRDLSKRKKYQEMIEQGGQIL